MIYIKEYDEFINEYAPLIRNSGDAILLGLYVGGISAVAFGLYKAIKAINAPSIDKKIKIIIDKHLTEEEKNDLVNMLDNDPMLKKAYDNYLKYFENKYKTSLNMLNGTVTKDTIIGFINDVNSDNELKKLQAKCNAEIIRVISPKYIKQYEAINKEVSETVGEQYNYLENDILKNIFGPNYKKQFNIK